MARPRHENPSPNALRMREARARAKAEKAGVPVADVPRPSVSPVRAPAAVAPARRKALRPVDVPASPGGKLDAILGAAATQALQPDASPHDVAVAAKAAREAVEAFGKARESGSRRSAVDASGPRRPSVEDVEAPTTPEEVRSLLSRIGAGLVRADPAQVPALRAMLDSTRKDGGEEGEEAAWIGDSAAFERRVAEAQHEEAFGGGQSGA